MSEYQNNRTIHCLSEGVIRTENDAPVYVLSASDFGTVVHVNDLNDDDTSTCSYSTINETTDNDLCECNNGARIIDSLGDQRHVTYSNIHIENSTDILLGTKAIFNEPVVIQKVQQLVVNSDSRIVNHNQQNGVLPDSMNNRN